MRTISHFLRSAQARESYLKAIDLLKPNSHPQIENNLKNVEKKIAKQNEMKMAAKESRRGKSEGMKRKREEVGVGVGGEL